MAEMYKMREALNTADRKGYVKDKVSSFPRNPRKHNGEWSYGTNV